MDFGDIIADGATIQIGKNTSVLGFWGTTPIVQPSGDILTALAAMGLVTNPTLSESDITTALGFTPVDATYVQEQILAFQEAQPLIDIDGGYSDTIFITFQDIDGGSPSTIYQTFYALDGGGV